jgi:uncharacterized alkaline shock family protein YloU
MMNGYYTTENGRISIAPNIVRSFVVKEIDSSFCFRFSPTRGEGFGEYFGKRSIDNSVRVSFMEGRADIALHLQVRFGTRIPLKAREMQGRIVRAISLGTGLEVNDIKITVDRVFCELDECSALPAPPTQSRNIELEEA